MGSDSPTLTAIAVEKPYSFVEYGKGIIGWWLVAAGFVALLIRLIIPSEEAEIATSILVLVTMLVIYITLAVDFPNIAHALMLLAVIIVSGLCLGFVNAEWWQKIVLPTYLIGLIIIVMSAITLAITTYCRTRCRFSIRSGMIKNEATGERINIAPRNILMEPIEIGAHDAMEGILTLGGGFIRYGQRTFQIVRRPARIQQAISQNRVH